MAENTVDINELEEDTQKNRYLTFSLGNETYAIEIMWVTEIIKIQNITKVPEMPDFVKGIINLRGKIIPIMDIRIRFNKEKNEYNDRTCVIIIDVDNMSIGIIVDDVSEVVTIEEENVVAPPQKSTKNNNKYIKSIGKVGNEIKMILDCEQLINDDFE